MKVKELDREPVGSGGRLDVRERGEHVWADAAQASPSFRGSPRNHDDAVGGAGGAGLRVWPVLLLPWFAVGVGWIGFGNAWIAIGLYHCGILALARGHLGPRLRRLLHGCSPRWTLALLLLLPVATVGFLAVLPFLLRPGFEPGDWLSARGLGAGALPLFVLVFGMIHPVLEEVHFQPLRAVAGWRAHLAYAGYHGVVLAECFPGWAVLSTVAFLTGVSVAFGAFDRGLGGPRLSLLLHLAGDLVVAGLALQWGGLL